MRRPLLAVLFMALVVAATATEPQELTYLTEDYPPENYVENGVLKGYAVEVLKAVWRKLGVPEQPIRVLPWARGYALAERQPNQVLFAMARTPERERLFQWVGPIYHAHVSLMSLAERPLRLTRLDQAKAFVVGVLNGDVGDEALKGAGFPETSLTRVNSLPQLLQMLKLGRIDLICANEPSLRNELARTPELKVNFRVSLVVEQLNVFYAVSLGTDPQVVARLQKALTAINSERLAIIARYNLAE